jgi:hypothetical protein
MKEKTLKLPLDLYESGILCHVLLRAIMDTPGDALGATPQRIQALYLKLTTLNDELMGKK